MRKTVISSFVYLVALSLAMLFGCGDDGGGAAGTGGSGGTGGTGGANTVPVSFVVTGFDPTTGFTQPLEDVAICETDTDNCVMTDVDGAATLQLPLNQEDSVTMEKEGYQAELLAALLTASPPVYTNGLATVERIGFLHGLVGSPYPMEGTGDVLASRAELGSFPGVTFSLSNTTGAGFYYDEEGNWDAALTATTNYALGPMGGFTEVSPGVAQVELGGTAEGCVPLTGWPGNVANSVRVPVRAGYFSEFLLSCNAP